MTTEQLNDFLKRHRLSPQSLADILGVSYPAVLHWISGVRTVSKTTSRLLKLFDKYPQLMQEFGK